MHRPASRAVSSGMDHRREERVDDREIRRRGKGRKGHSPLVGGSLARCLSAAAHRRGPLPLRGQPRTRPTGGTAVTHSR